MTVRGNGLTIQGSACCGDIILKSGDTNTSGIIQAYRSGVLIWTRNKSVLGLGTNNQTHLRITENGRVGIGTLDPQVKLDVNGWVRAKKFETVAGSDLAEPFSVVTNEHIIEPGMVVTIDPTHAGQLRIADTAYDKTVAGILSGANGVNSGIIMQQEELTSDGDRLVALTGRVYVWADAQYGAIEPGDLLTTSATPGHAMKVNDHARAQGAILGKAMTALDEGTGFVLVLVSLQ